MTWTFGVEPLPQTAEVAQALRRITSLVLSLEGEDDAVADLLDGLRRAEAALAERVPDDLAPRVGDREVGRVYLDHSRDIGSFNPCFPEYAITVDGDRASGEVRFPILFEGPPGIVHGGFLALFFDCVMQHHSCDVGVAGKTISLALRYRRPTPIGTDLRFELTRTVADGRIRSTGTLLRGGDVLCEAEMDALAGDQASLPAVSPRREQP
jgi:acyl-coenzyme A thioesterase PaaI-like protein